LREGQAKEFEDDKATPPFVLVVILNWNNSEQTIATVETVLQQSYPRFRVLTIDNGSSAAQVASLRGLSGERVEVFEFEENRGYTGGCNEGLRRGLEERADYVWLLNSDAEVEDKNTLHSLVELAESDAKIGLVSPRLAEPGEGGSLNWCGGFCSMSPPLRDATSDPEVARRWAEQYPDAGMVRGTALLVKSSLIRAIGMFDEKFFAYAEDDDYSYRSSQAGYRNLVDEKCLVRHPDKNSILDPFAIKPHVWYYAARNDYRFWRKHLGTLRALRPCWWGFLKTLRDMRRCRGNDSLTDAMLAGTWHGWTGRTGAYDPGYRMPGPLAALVWRYALWKDRSSSSRA
jgi:GT2 family glycosyltransferase